MATFEAQVEGLTGLTIDSSGTTPIHSELQQFLRDGVIAVINKITQLSPDELWKFSSTTHDDGSGVTITGRVLSVVREHDSTTILRPCTLISSQDRSLANDTSSLKYRSKYNPAYYILDKKIFSVPPGSDNDNDLIVTQVYYDETITHESDDMDNFPREYIPLVVLYAAIKSLEAQMAQYTIIEEDPELVQSISANIISLQNSFRSGFQAVAPQQQQAGEANEG
mgnify:CR=1 FL=1